MKNVINIGDCIKTPEFSAAHIEAIFKNEMVMTLAGYNVPTGYESEDFTICGKRIGENIVFAAAYKPHALQQHTYVAVYTMEAVRNVEIFSGEDVNDPDSISDDDNWELDELAEVFIGIYHGPDVQTVEAVVAEDKQTTTDCIKLIKIS